MTGGLLLYVNHRNISGWAAFCQYRDGELCDELLASLERGARPELPACGATELLYAMLDPDPGTRALMSECLAFEWLELHKVAPVEFDHAVYERLRRRCEGSVLRKGLLELIGTMLEGRCIEYYQHIWDQYDTNDDDAGRMAPDEFAHMMEFIQEAERADEQARVVTGRLPSPSKIPVAALELRPYSPCRTPAPLSPTSQSPMSPEKLYALSCSSPEDGVSFQEFVGLMFNPDAMQAEEKMQFFESAFRAIGGDDAITIDELEAFFDGQDDGLVRELFKAMDKDGDGVVDSDEFASFVSQL